MDAYDKPKKGPKPLDKKGFEGVIARVRASLSRSPTATVVYVKGKGFKVVTVVKEYMQSLIDAGLAVVVGVYQKGVIAQYLVEDFVFMTDQIAMGKFK